MTPGSIEFRNHILKTLPQQGGEQRAQYLQRAARHFRFSTQRLHDLFYDPRTELSVEEHEVLFGQTPATPPRKHDDFEKRLQDLERQIKVQERDIRNEVIRDIRERFVAVFDEVSA